MGIGGAALDLYLSSEVFQIKKKKNKQERIREGKKIEIQGLSAPASR